MSLTNGTLLNGVLIPKLLNRLNREGPSLDPRGMFSLSFSYLLNFCRQWH